MPLQTSGQISFLNIADEKNVIASNLSLHSLATTKLNTDPCNPSTADNGAPHAISEFYGYDHNCVSGPTLIEKTYAGIYRDSFEVCQADPFRSEQFTFYVEVDEDGAERIAYLNPLGTEFPPDGYYIDMDRLQPLYIERGNLLFIICDDRGGGLEPDPDKGDGGGFEPVEPGVSK
jgi:hypothetical protein